MRSAHRESRTRWPASTFDVPGAATDERRAARGQAAVGALRTPQPELDDRGVARRQHDPRRLRRDEVAKLSALSTVVSTICASSRPPRDAQQRLEREDGRALGNRVDVQADPEVGEVGQEVGREDG